MTDLKDEDIADKIFRLGEENMSLEENVVFFEKLAGKGNDFLDFIMK